MQHRELQATRVSPDHWAGPRVPPVLRSHFPPFHLISFLFRFLSSSIVQAAHAEPFHSVPSHHTHTLSLSRSRPGSCRADTIPSPLPFAPPAFLRACGHAPDHLLDQPSNSHLQRGLPTCITVAQLLVKHGADTTAQSKDGTTPLHPASECGHVDVAWLLIEHGTDATAQSKDGMTPLHQVSLQGYVHVAQLLIEHGADVTTQSKDRKTPLQG